MLVATVFQKDDELGELSEATWRANVQMIEEAPTIRDRLDEAIRLLERCYDERFEDEVAAFIVKVRP